MLLKDRKKIIIDVFAELEKRGVGYAVLRNGDEIGRGEEKDIDIISKPSQFNEIRQVLITIGEPSGWFVISVNVVGKGMQIHLSKENVSSSDCSFERAIQVHVVAYVSVKTGSLQRAINGYSKKIWFSQIEVERDTFRDVGMMVPTDQWKLLFFFERILTKNKASYVEGANQLLEKGIADQLGLSPFHLKEMINDGSNGVLKATRMLYKTLNPVFDLRSHLNDVVSLICQNTLSLFRRKGIIIFFSGPDGAGKSTTVNNLADFLQMNMGLSVVKFKDVTPIFYYLGSYPTKFQELIRGVPASASGAVKQTKYRDRQPETGLILWKARRMMGLLSYVFQYYFGYVSLILRTMLGQTVIVDTSVFDRFVKSHRPRFPLIERFFIPLLPNKDVVFHLVSAPPKIVKRKPELSEPEIRSYYQAMESIFNMTKIDRKINIRSDAGEEVAARHVCNEAVALLIQISKQ